MQAEDIQIRLSGPPEALVDGRRIDPGTPQRRHLLWALAVDAGRPVTIDQLIARLWDDAPPSAARESVYSTIARLRRAFREQTSGPDRVYRRADGYVLDVPPRSVDLQQFGTLARQAADRRISDERRGTVLQQALQLWAGPPLANVPGAWAAGYRAAWLTLHTNLLIEWAEYRLRRGQIGELLRTLPGALEDQPVTEPLEDVFLRALHGAGRTAEALRRFAVIRHRLADELGVDPGPRLRRTHEALLRGDKVTTGS